MLCKYTHQTTCGKYTCWATDEICENYYELNKCLVRVALDRVSDEIHKNYKKGLDEGYKKGIEDSFDKYTQRLVNLIKEE